LAQASLNLEKLDTGINGIRFDPSWVVCFGKRNIKKSLNSGEGPINLVRPEEISGSRKKGTEGFDQSKKGVFPN